MIEAPSAAHFCNVIGRTKVNGYWSGSAFRKHPRGIFRERMLFTNEWNTHNYCSVKVATDPDAKLLLGCNAPAAYCDPYPTVSSGELVTVYQNGSWIADGPWCEKIVRILGEVQGEITKIREAEMAEHEARKLQSRKRAASNLEAARAALT